MNGSPSSRQKATPVASTRLSRRERPRSSHSPIRLNGRTQSLSEPCRTAGRWSYRISSRSLKRGMWLSSIIAGPETNRRCFSVAAPKPALYSPHVKKTVLVYGLLGGVLIAALHLIQYRFLVLEHSVEIYGGLVALVFSALGIWLGRKLTRVRDVPVIAEVQVEVPVLVQVGRPF